MKKGTLYRLMIGLLISTVVLVSCDSSGGEEPTTTDTSELEDVTVQLSWVPTIEFAGFYEAEDNGYYTEEGLAATFESGGFDADGNYISPVDRVVNGAADIGVTSADTLLDARAAGHDLVAVAAIYQRNPVVLFSKAEDGIRTPQDLVGKRIGHNPGSSTDRIYKAMLAAQGITVDQIEEFSNLANAQDIIDGNVDVAVGFITNQALVLELAGYETNLILPSDYGIDLYSNVIFTTRDTIDNNPELVERFLRATFKGMQTAIDDPADAAQVAFTRNADLDVENEETAMIRSLPLFKPAGTQMGQMNADVWTQAHQILLDQGFLSEPLEIEQAYDLSFLEKIHGE